MQTLPDLTHVQISLSDFIGSLGGQIEGSNTSETDGYEPLYYFPDSLGEIEQPVPIAPGKGPFRFLRYKRYEANNNGVTELVFKNGDHVLKGRIFGSQNEPGHGADKAFDGNPDTFALRDKAGLYVGIDLARFSGSIDPTASLQATRKLSITPSDTAILDFGGCWYLQVLTDGSLALSYDEDETPMILQVRAGRLLRYTRPKKVLATGTTATVCALF